MCLYCYKCILQFKNNISVETEININCVGETSFIGFNIQRFMIMKKKYLALYFALSFLIV